MAENAAGVEICRGKRICLHYRNTGSCHPPKDDCTMWHICKQFVEGDCSGGCDRSHDFHDDDNREKTKEYALQDCSNEHIRRIVGQSLPQVCLAYLESNCKSTECPYLHICSSVARKTDCECALSHNITDYSSQNLRVLERYNLSELFCKSTLLCNILVPVEQIVHSRKDSFNFKLVQNTRCQQVSHTISRTLRNYSVARKMTQPSFTIQAGKKKKENAINSSKLGKWSIPKDPGSTPVSKLSRFAPADTKTRSVVKRKMEPIGGHMEKEKMPQSRSAGCSSSNYMSIPLTDSVNIRSNPFSGEKKMKGNKKANILKVSTSKAGRSMTSQDSNSFLDDATVCSNPLFTDVQRKEKSNGYQKPVRDVSPSTLGGSFTSNLCQGIPKFLHVTDCLPISPLLVDKGELQTGDGVHQKKENVTRNVSNSLTSQDTKRTPELFSGTNVAPIHSSSFSREENRQESFQRCQKEKFIQPHTSGSKEIVRQKRSLCELPTSSDYAAKRVKDIKPSHWSSMAPNSKYVRVKLEVNTMEFEEVEKLFRETMKDDKVIVSIDRVQNPFLWEKYCRKKENMLQDSPKNTANEKQLFHGTSSNLVDAICKQNFDWRMGGKHGKKYGEGSYFAIQASCSHCYTGRDVDGHYFMFLARVLIGLYVEGKSTYRRPPLKDRANPASDLYDSCVDDQYRPTIFVVFDMDQCYPEYVIKYLKLENCPTSQVQNANTGPRSRPLSSNRVQPYSPTRVRRPKTAPAIPQVKQLTNPRQSSGRLRSNRVLSPSKSESPITAPGKSLVKWASPRTSSGRLSSYRVLPRSISSFERPITAPGNRQENLANPGSLSGNLRSSRPLSSSVPNLYKPLTEPRIPQSNRTSPRRSNGRLGSDKELSSSTTAHVGWPNKAPENPQMSLAYQRMSSERLSSNTVRPSSPVRFQRPSTASGNPQVNQLANERRFNGRLRSNSVRSPSVSKFEPSITTHEISQVKWANPRRSSGRLNSYRGLPLSISSFERPVTAPGNCLKSLANPGSLSGNLKSSGLMSSSMPDVQVPITEPRIPQLNRTSPRRSSERLGSDSVLSSSTTNVHWSHKAPENPQMTLAYQRMSNGHLSPNIALPSAPGSFQRPNTAPGNPEVNQLPNPRRASERLSSNLALPPSPSSVPRPKTAPAILQVKQLTNPRRSSGRLRSNRVLSPSKSESPITAPGKSLVKWASPRTSSGRLSSYRGLPLSISSFERPFTAPGNRQENLANPGSLSGNLRSSRPLSSSVPNLYKPLTEPRIPQSNRTSPRRSNGRLGSDKEPSLSTTALVGWPNKAPENPQMSLAYQRMSSERLSSNTVRPSSPVRFQRPSTASGNPQVNQLANERWFNGRLRSNSVRSPSVSKFEPSITTHENAQVKWANPRRSSGRLNSYRGLPLSISSFERPITAPGNCLKSLANPGSLSGNLKSSGLMSSSMPDVQVPITEPRIPQLNRTSPRRSSERLGSDSVLSSSTTNVHWSHKAPENPQMTLAYQRMSTGQLSPNIALPSAPGSFQQPNTAPGNAEVNQLPNPRRSSERLSSDLALPPSPSSVRRPNKAPGDGQVTEQHSNPGLSSGLLSSNLALPPSPSSVQQPNKASGDAQVTEQLANPGRSSGRFSSNRALPSSAVKRPITSATGNPQVNLTNQKRSTSNVQCVNKEPEDLQMNLAFFKPFSKDSQSADPRGPAGGLSSNRELSARFSIRQHPGEGPGDSRGNTTTPCGSSTRRISKKTSGSNGRHNSKKTKSNCCSCLIL